MPKRWTQKRAKMESEETQNIGKQAKSIDGEKGGANREESKQEIPPNRRRVATAKVRAVHSESEETSKTMRSSLKQPHEGARSSLGEQRNSKKHGTKTTRGKRRHEIRT